MVYLLFIALFAVFLLIPLLIAVFVVGMTRSAGSGLLRARIQAVFLACLLVLVGVLAGIYGASQLMAGTFVVRAGVSFTRADQPWQFVGVALGYLLLVIMNLYLGVRVYRTLCDRQGEAL